MTAVWLLMQQENFFEAVIGNGEDHSIAEWLEACFSRVDLDWRNYVVIENDFVPEYRRLVSDPARLRSLGFHPQVSFIDLADRMMECL